MKRKEGRRIGRGIRSRKGKKEHLTMPKHFMSIDLWHKATSYTMWRIIHTYAMVHRRAPARVPGIKVLLYVLRIPPLITLDTYITSRSAEGQYSLRRYVSKTSRAIAIARLKPSITRQVSCRILRAFLILLILIALWIISPEWSVANILFPIRITSLVSPSPFLLETYAVGW